MNVAVDILTSRLIHNAERIKDLQRSLDEVFDMADGYRDQIRQLHIENREIEEFIGGAQ